MDVKEIEVVNCDDDEEDDWLPPPPKVVVENQLGEDSTIKELRYTQMGCSKILILYFAARLFELEFSFW